MFSTSSVRTRPLVALRALAALASDPDDLPKVFTVIDSLPGRSADRMLARMRASKDGSDILATRPDLGARLADRAALHALPEGTLGRAYAEMADRAGISPKGIVDASIAGTPDRSSVPQDQRTMGDRMRDTHDLWHVVTGYGLDVLGEVALLCFIYAQTKHPGIALVAFLAVLKSVPNARPLMLEGYRRGRRAEWLPAVAWESLLDRPLTEVRALLRVGAPPVYEPVTTAALRELGAVPDRAAA
jgi:ubiquinone biosynthesis protein COQ4